MVMKKEIRQNKIEQLISQNVISTQEELLNALKKIGIKATQATISRDIHELKIIKESDGNGNIRYAIFKPSEQSEEEKLYQCIAETVVDVKRVEFLNIVQTTPRGANVLAVILDDIKLQEIAGTIAGHDTLVVISATTTEANYVYDLLREHINPIYG